MKKVSFLIITCFLVLNSSATITPKETVIKFITNIKKLDFEQAQTYVTEDTKPYFISLKLKFQNSNISEEELIKSKSVNQDVIVKEYGLDLLIETIANKNAIVKPKDGINRIILENVNGYWKIVCNKDLMDAINLESNYKKMVSDFYSKLLSSYQRRSNTINLIINSSNIYEANSIRQKLKEIKNTNSTLSNYLEYLTKQNELSKLIIVYKNKVNIPENFKQELQGNENRIGVNKLDFDKSAVNYNKTSYFGHIKLLPNIDKPTTPPDVQF